MGTEIAASPLAPKPPPKSKPQILEQRAGSTHPQMPRQMDGAGRPMAGGLQVPNLSLHPAVRWQPRHDACNAPPLSSFTQKACKSFLQGTGLFYGWAIKP